jgi:uncharacterized protein
VTRTVHLVTGGRWHDFDYARQQLLELVQRPDVSVRDLRDWPAELDPSDVLITYTCDLRPDQTARRQLVDFVENGGRWLALHATNSTLEPPAPGATRVFAVPDLLGEVAVVLGSRFLAHPPIAPYEVQVSAPDHPLVQGIAPFTVRDELYVLELHEPIEVLLHTRYSGPCPSFENGDTTDDAPRPVLYLRRCGAGEVVYFTLGHCRTLAELHAMGKLDAVADDRGSWVIEEFRTVLARCVDRVLTPG